MNKITEDTTRISDLLPLLQQPYSFRENTDNLLSYGKGLVAIAKEILPAKEVYSLLYFFDQCKKGHYEDLKNNKATAHIYFEKNNAYLQNNFESAASYHFHVLLGNIFMAHHYSVQEPDPAKATALWKQALIFCNELSSISISKRKFFAHLHIFIWLSHQKILIKQGEAVFAINEMATVLTEGFRKKITAGLQKEEDDDYAIIGVFNVLYQLSILSPAFSGYFKNIISEAATAKPIPIADDFIIHFLKAEKAVIENNINDLAEAFEHMLNTIGDSRQLYMLTAVFADVYSISIQEEDSQHEGLWQSFQNLAKIELPLYLLNKVKESIKDKKSVSLSN